MYLVEDREFLLLSFFLHSIVYPCLRVLESVQQRLCVAAELVETEGGKVK